MVDLVLMFAVFVKGLVLLNLTVIVTVKLQIVKVLVEDQLHLMNVVFVVVLVSWRDNVIAMVMY